MRVEGDDRRLEAGRADRVDDRPMAPVDAVEAPDRDRARAHVELCRVVDDGHESRASASSGARISSGSASSTWNGPISVRRSETQCPPSASAIERT